MPRYGRDFGERSFPVRPRERHWFGDGYDAGYRGRERPAREGWRGHDRGWAAGPEPGFPHERYGQVDYRGGYGRTHRAEEEYDAGYGFRPRPEGRRYGREGRFRDWGPAYGYGFEGESYGDYGAGMFRGGGLFRSARGGGIEPGRFFRGYGIGSAGSYEPY